MKSWKQRRLLQLTTNGSDTRLVDHEVRCDPAMRHITWMTHNGGNLRTKLRSRRWEISTRRDPLQFLKRRSDMRATLTQTMRLSEWLKTDVQTGTNCGPMYPCVFPLGSRPTKSHLRAGSVPLHSRLIISPCVYTSIGSLFEMRLPVFIGLTAIQERKVKHRTSFQSSNEAKFYNI